MFNKFHYSIWVWLSVYVTFLLCVRLIRAYIQNTSIEAIILVIIISTSAFIPRALLKGLAKINNYKNKPKTQVF